MGVAMLTEFQKRKLIKLFSMYDACNLGVLKISDFEQLAQRLAVLRGWKVDSIQYEDISSKFIYLWNRMRSEIKNVYNSLPEVLNNPEAWNTQIRSQVTVEEWFTYFGVVLNNSEYHQEIVDLSDAIFNVVDIDESGHLDKGEWADLFRVYNISVLYVDESFAKIDVNGDGTLSKDEVVSMIEDFYFSNDPAEAGNYMFGPI
jgi:Ca2+-binding EF-hand superfamily protein